MRPHIMITFDHAGETFETEVPSEQQIRAAFVRALEHFGIDPSAADRYQLTHDGRRININQSFADAGIPDKAGLRVRPRTQRNGTL